MISPDKSAVGTRTGIAFLALFIGATLLGSLLAPQVFNLLLGLGRRCPDLAFLRNLEFESVAGRCVMLFILLGFFPVLKLSGIRHVRELGFVPGIRGRRLLLRGFLLGLLSLGGVYILGWASGAYFIQVDDKLKSFYKVVGILAGSLLLAFFEETLVRGFLFGSLRKSLGLWSAALITSFIFMTVHFARPVLPISPVFGNWDSGLQMIPHMFYGGYNPNHYFPYMLTLFLMGLVLCLYFDSYRHIGMVIGMHAGWVVAWRFGGYLFDRQAGTLPFLFGQSDVVSKSFMALLVAIGFLAWNVHKRRKAAPPE